MKYSYRHSIGYIYTCSDGRVGALDALDHKGAPRCNKVRQRAALALHIHTPTYHMLSNLQIRCVAAGFQRQPSNLPRQADVICMSLNS